jgi:uncharacterized membrane-anchored protein YhcB (DUF1043 family)
MDANTFSIISISIPMVIGFIGLFFSVLSSSSFTNHRIADLRVDVDRKFDTVDRRFDEQKADINQRFNDVKTDMNQRFDEVDRRFDDVNKRLDEQKSEINLVSNRLNIYIDNFAVRLMTENSARVTRRKTVAKV